MHKQNVTPIKEAIVKLMKANYCFGIMSNTYLKDFHVLFFDFDGDVNLPNIMNSLKHIQKDFNLSTIYIINSLNGFNAICLDILHIDTIKKILDHTKYIDKLFVDLGYEKNNCYILRMDLDKCHIEFLKSIPPEHGLVSTAHAWFFSEIMNYPIHCYPNMSNDYKFRIVAYKSVKHGYCNLYNDTVKKV